MGRPGRLAWWYYVCHWILQLIVAFLPFQRSQASRTRFTLTTCVPSSSHVEILCHSRPVLLTKFLYEFNQSVFAYHSVNRHIGFDAPLSRLLKLKSCFWGIFLCFLVVWMKVQTLWRMCDVRKCRCMTWARPRVGVKNNVVWAKVI